MHPVADNPRKTLSNVRKALFLTRNFPPLVTGGSSRAWKLASNLSTIGWTPVVVAPPAVRERDAAIPSGSNRVAEVHRTGPETDAAGLEAADMNALLHGRPVTSRRPLAARLTGLFKDDDAGAIWQKLAAEHIERLLAEQPEIDMLYAQGPPIEPLMLALETAKKHPLTVVLDITAPLDPAMPAPGATGSSSAAEAEVRILLAGVPMLTPTRALKEYFLKKYIGRLDHGSITIVPPSFDSSHPAFRKAPKSTPDRIMRIALYIDDLPKADLKALVKGIEAWFGSDRIGSGDVELTCFGEGAPELANRTAKSPIRQMLSIDLSGSIGDQLDHCRNADLFCAVLARTPASTCTVPDRLVDALGMGLPLSAVLPDGPAAKLVIDTGGMTAPAGDAEAIAGLFRTMAAARRDGTLRYASEELRQNYHTGNVIHELTRAIAVQHVR